MSFTQNPLQRPAAFHCLIHNAAAGVWHTWSRWWRRGGGWTVGWGCLQHEPRLSVCQSAVRLMCPTESCGHSQTDRNGKNTKFGTERRRVSESEMMNETGSKEPVMMFISWRSPDHSESVGSVFIRGGEVNHLTEPQSAGVCQLVGFNSYMFWFFCVNTVSSSWTGIKSRYCYSSMQKHYKHLSVNYLQCLKTNRCSLNLFFRSIMFTPETKPGLTDPSDELMKVSRDHSLEIKTFYQFKLVIFCFFLWFLEATYWTYFLTVSIRPRSSLTCRDCSQK